jgi:hypothetical protein
VGTIVFALAFPAAFRFQVVGAGRYIYPAEPVAAALCAIGIGTVLTNVFARRAAVTLYALAAAGILAAAAAGLPAPATPAPGPGTPPPDATMVSQTASGRLEGVTISVNRVAFDPRARATWIEVSVSNSSPVEIDWPVVPVVAVGGELVFVDYRRSTHLPGDIDAGQSATGWLFVALDPATVHQTEPVLLRFQDVAVDNYRTVKDVNVRFEISSGVAARSSG